MSCEIIEKEGSLITARISGLLKREELAQVEKIAVADMKAGNKVRFLILVENFMGWDNRDNWGDVSFQSQYDDRIEKIALVCDEQWQDLAEAFVGKGIRSVEIRQFTPSQTALAKAWIK